MGFVASTLLDGESVRYRAALSLWRFAPRLLLGIGILGGSAALLIYNASSHSPHPALKIAALIGLLIGAVLFGWPFLVRRSVELAVTDRRVIRKIGMVSTSSIEIRFEKIETVRVQQGFLGRVLNYGDIEIRGTGSSFEPIEHIGRPLEFKNALDQAMDAWLPSREARHFPT